MIADNPYLYVGELGYYDHWQAPALADMLHLGVRFYEPAVGRFGQRDRVRCSVAPYAYVSAVPTLRVDPSGLWPPTELAFGDGRIGVDSSCHPCKDNKKIDARIRNIVSLGGPTSSLPAAPEKGISWASTDGQSIPDGVSFTRGSFVPARPTSRHTILKIRDGWDCVWSCSKTEVKLHCGPNARLTLAMLPISPSVVRDAATVYFLISQPQWLLQGVQ